MEKKVKLFLDSGAFSAWSIKKTQAEFDKLKLENKEQYKLDERDGLYHMNIDIQKYIAHIKEFEKYLDHYAVLDVIYDPVKTLENQKIMEAAGLHPIPCFHYGEDDKYLQDYLDNYDYIGLGGMVPVSTANLRVWLDHLFGDLICDSDGMPKVKIHGFGMTVVDLMIRYPWGSCDSSSWVLTGRFGAVLVPKFRNGKYDYLKSPWRIIISNRSPKKLRAGQHFDTFSPMEKEVILNYFNSHGFVIGRSEYRKEDRKTYMLNKGERWEDRDTVETVIEPGLSNTNTKRDELNIIYFLDLEDHMPEWPWRFKRKT